jgi:hypothetical protein
MSLAPLSPLMHRRVDQHVQMLQEGGFEPEDLDSLCKWAHQSMVQAFRP